MDILREDYSGIVQQCNARKQAEEALKDSEEQLRALFDNSKDAIGISKTGVAVMVNQAYLDMFGYSNPDEIVGKSILAQFSPKEHDRIKDYIAKRDAGPAAPRCYETIGIRKDGTEFPFELNVGTFMLHGDKFTVGIIRDITERKKIESELREHKDHFEHLVKERTATLELEIDKHKHTAALLRESEEKYRNIVDNSSSIILEWSPEGTILYLNKYGLDFFGFTAEEIIGRNVLGSIVAPIDESGYDLSGKMKNVQQHPEEYYSSENENLCKSGKKVWIAWTNKGIRNPSGDLVKTLSIGIDRTQVKQLEDELKQTHDLVIINQRLKQEILDRQRAEETLRESEERYRTLADNGQALIWTSGLDKKCDYFNSSWLAFTGKPIKEELGDGWVKGVHPDDLQKCIDTYIAAFDRKEKFSMIYRLRHNSGEYRWIQDDGTPRYNYKGDFIGYIGHCLDITDRIQTEEVLHTAQKLESLGLLAGGIAHDFNNLLGGIFGYMEMAHEIATDDILRQYISKAMNSIDRGRHLTQQLLTFAKGGAPVKAIGNLFPHVRDVVQFALSGSNVSCTFDISDDLPACSFDKNQIAQVIDNIVINAKQAMPDGGKIEVSAHLVTVGNGQHGFLEKGDYIQISIRDHGIGMPKEILHRIFDPFYTTKATGNGLGLATCYSIIKRHGGCIDVESEPGKGSMFQLYLPASTDTLEVPELKHKKKHKGSGTFIVMDDEEVIRETIGNILESFGYQVLYAEDGQEAVDILTSEIRSGRNVSALLLDLTIPGRMGGKEAINEIRKITANIPVFVISGYADNPVMAKPEEFGFSASICKPFRKTELADLLNKHLKSAE
jgi:PAS domain S-box-containing protein